MIERFAIAGYRSIESIILRLSELNVVTGSNGSGKSNLYRSLRLLTDAAHGRLAETLAREGGFDSVRWAGRKRHGKDPVSLRLGFMSDAYSYSLDMGLPVPMKSAFDRDPEVKRECLWLGAGMDAKSMIADRRGQTLRCRAASGKWQDVDLVVSQHASMLTEYADPFRSPELLFLRDSMRSWRFYDTFRTDAGALARQPSIATRTPVLSNDGHDLASALQTIREIGDAQTMDSVVDDAFPGSVLKVSGNESGLTASLLQPGMRRDLVASEWSDGTLRFLLLVAALLTPRPPELMVLNEPENSLHPDLIPALCRLIKLAAENGQVIVVSHNQTLVEELEADEICSAVRLTKDEGATVLQDGDLLSQMGWKWPTR